MLLCQVFNALPISGLACPAITGEQSHLSLKMQVDQLFLVRAGPEHIHSTSESEEVGCLCVAMPHSPDLLWILPLLSHVLVLSRVLAPD